MDIPVIEMGGSDEVQHAARVVPRVMRAIFRHLHPLDGLVALQGSLDMSDGGVDVVAQNLSGLHPWKDAMLDKQPNSVFVLEYAHLGSSALFGMVFHKLGGKSRLLMERTNAFERTEVLAAKYTEFYMAFLKNRFAGGMKTVDTIVVYASAGGSTDNANNVFGWLSVSAPTLQEYDERERPLLSSNYWGKQLFSMIHDEQMFGKICRVVLCVPPLWECHKFLKFGGSAYAHDKAFVSVRIYRGAHRYAEEGLNDFEEGVAGGWMPDNVGYVVEGGGLATVRSLYREIAWREAMMVKRRRRSTKSESDLEKKVKADD